MTNDPQNFGQIYKQVRRRRNLAITQVHGELHASAVSHFERDSQDVKLSNLITLLQPTLMPPDEFIALADRQHPSLQAIFADLGAAYDRMDLPALNALYDHASAADLPHQLVKWMIRLCRDEIAQQSTTFSAAESETIEAYLMQDGPWFAFEYEAFGNLLYGLPEAVNLRLLNKMLREYQTLALPAYAPLLQSALYNLSVTWLEAKNYPATKHVLTAIDALVLPPRSLYFKHHVQFLKLMLTKLEHPEDADNNAAIAQFLAVTATIDPELAKKNAAWLAQLT